MQGFIQDISLGGGGECVHESGGSTYSSPPLVDREEVCAE